MAEEKKIDYNALAQALDTTFGRSSTPFASSYSVKFQLLGERGLRASYCAIVNFGTERAMIDMKKRYGEESAAIISEVLKSIKKTYKELCGETLETKEVSTEDSLEVTNMSPYNPKRTAYFRRKTVFSL